MTIAHGWSLDFTGARRRIAAALTAAIAGSLLLVPATTLGAAAYDPASDANSMYSTTKYTGASGWWTAGYTGEGVDVALIDTGVSPVPGLATKDKIVYGPDLSFESQAENLRNLDTNGHGTFMAGLIAGRDSTLTKPYADAPASAYRGMAPDARIVSLKVGVADGAVDVSQVIAAIDWVVQHKNDNGLNIRVLNLSYGTNSTQAPDVDPLAFAVEQAWKAGIVVVVAAGNATYQTETGSPTLANPAFNPYVIAVGVSDSRGTLTTSDDTVALDSPEVAAYCTKGCRNPDLVAPGSHIQGLRVPNSYIDVNHPEGRLGERFFRGSGTSQAAAVTSGAAALVLQRNPKYSPDDVKAYLRAQADSLGDTAKVMGRGQLDLSQIAWSGAGRYTQGFLPATGSGSLERSRGTDHLTHDGVVLTGEIDIFGHRFESAYMAKLEAARISWSGGVWNGNTWTGNGWTDTSWSGSTWSGNTWSGNTWSGNTWSGNSWSGNSWSGNSWSGNTWSGNSWSGNTWSGNSWSGNSWSGGTWAAGSWD